MDYSNLSNEELERLVNNKDGDAICELGERCMYGTKGHVKNLNRAYQLFHKGEKMGLQRAYIGLAEMYQNGIHFARNEKLADEYYQKAGVGNNVERQTYTEQEFVNNRSDSLYFGSDTSQNASINTSEIRNIITKAENARKQDNFREAKQQCSEALKMLDSIASGIVSYTGTDDLDILRIDTYWTLAFIAFNEQQVSEMEKYLSKEGVQAIHPWGVYLATIVHKNIQAPDVVLEQDLQTLIMVSQNQNLSMEEKSDVTMMIADLILDGYGADSGCTVEMARNYCQESANCGNIYAQEQLAKFTTTITGKVKYNG